MGLYYFSQGGALMKTGKTPSGLECWIPDTESDKIYIMNQTRGRFQREVARALIEKGYIIEYKPTGATIKGNARKYTSKYQRSIKNLMDRIGGIPGYPLVVAGAVGPKGAFGYYLVWSKNWAEG